MFGVNKYANKSANQCFKIEMKQGFLGFIIRQRRMSEENISLDFLEPKIHFSMRELKPKFMQQLNLRQGSKKRLTRRTIRRTQRPIQMMNLSHFKFSYQLIPEELQRIEALTTRGNTKIYGKRKNGKISGMCKIFYEQGELFEGKCEFGIKLQGRITFKDGTIYEGKFSEDKFHGPGVIIDPSKRKVSCYWNKGIPGKRGRIDYPSGEVYIGQLSNLKKNGKGVIFLRNGDRYIGHFIDGKVDGELQYLPNEESSSQESKRVSSLDKNNQEIFSITRKRLFSKKTIQCE